MTLSLLIISAIDPIFYLRSYSQVLGIRTFTHLVEKIQLMRCVCTRSKVAKEVKEPVLSPQLYKIFEPT
jgi:hypothetical protein